MVFVYHRVLSVVVTCTYAVKWRINRNLRTLGAAAMVASVGKGELG